MSEQQLLQVAVRLDGEYEQLQRVVADLADHVTKRAYARWLADRNDRRGTFLQQVLDDWNSGNDALADDESVDATWKNTCGVTLLRKLREGRLDSHAPAICSAARPALKLTPVLVPSELPVGATKFGGKPDLPEGAAWPEYKGKLHTFLGQFRLADLSEIQAGTLLPPDGLLSFFVFNDPIETGQPAAEGAKGAYQVVYTPEAARLQRCEPSKAFDEGNALAPECVLRMQETLDLPDVNTYNLGESWADKFTACRRARALGLTEEQHDAYEATLDALLPDRCGVSHLLGWSHPQVLADDPVNEDFRHLLTVASEGLLEWCWADGHQLYFSLRTDDLASGRFDRCEVIDG